MRSASASGLAADGTEGPAVLEIGVATAAWSIRLVHTAVRTVSEAAPVRQRVRATPARRHRAARCGARPGLTARWPPAVCGPGSRGGRGGATARPRSGPGVLRRLGKCLGHRLGQVVEKLKTRSCETLEEREPRLRGRSFFSHRRGQERLIGPEVPGLRDQLEHQDVILGFRRQAQLAPAQVVREQPPVQVVHRHAVVDGKLGFIQAARQKPPQSRDLGRCAHESICRIPASADALRNASGSSIGSSMPIRSRTRRAALCM